MPKFIEEKKCTGCTACMSICPQQCINMKKDNNGFFFPQMVSSVGCIDCGACERVCPIAISDKQNACFPMAYAAFSNNESWRMESSSGGIFSELAKIIILENGVVYGAVYDDKYEVRHCSVDSVDDIGKLRGAKYAESNLQKSFVNILERLKKGQKVLFSGTPCQVAGLKAFVKKEYENLYCVDFVCHGVPSPMVWKEYVKYRTRQDADGEMPQAINLRSKTTGWSKYQYSNVFEYKNGKRHSVLSSDSLFMRLFVGNYISRQSCENCKFKGYNRDSDITLGDFWGIWDIDLEMDDNKGTSVVLVHSPKGKKLWSEIDSQIKSKEVTLVQASQENRSMLISSKANARRDIVLDRIREGHIEECEKLFDQPKVSMMSRVKGEIKRLIHRS